MYSNNTDRRYIEERQRYELSNGRPGNYNDRPGNNYKRNREHEIRLDETFDRNRNNDRNHNFPYKPTDTYDRRPIDRHTDRPVERPIDSYGARPKNGNAYNVRPQPSGYSERHPDTYDRRYKNNDEHDGRRPEDDRYYADTVNRQGYNDDTYLRKPSSVTYKNDPQIDYYEKDTEFNKSKNRMKYILLGFAIFFIIGAIALSIVSIAMTPWWTQDKSEGGESWVKIGLWKSCIKEATEYECRDYSDDAFTESPYSNIKVLQYCMVAGAATSILSIVFVIIAFMARNTKGFRYIVYFATFLIFAAVALFIVVIGFSLELDKTEDLVPKWISNKLSVAQNDIALDIAVMFILACVAVGSSAMALIFLGVFLFISSDNDDLSDDDEQGGHIRSNSWNYDYRIEREISDRNKQAGSRNITPPPYLVKSSVDREREPLPTNGYVRPEFYEYGQQKDNRYKELEPRPQEVKIQRSKNRNERHRESEVVEAQFEDRNDHYNKYRSKQAYQSYKAYGTPLANNQEIPRTYVTHPRPTKAFSDQGGRPARGVNKYPDYPDTNAPPIGTVAHNLRNNERNTKAKSYDQYEMYFNSPY